MRKKFQVASFKEYMIQKRILILFQISFFVVFFFFGFQVRPSHSQVTSFNLDIDFVSNYLHRGVSKSSNKPAIQFDLKYTIPRSNINIGLWKSNINHYGLSSEYRYVLDYSSRFNFIDYSFGYAYDFENSIYNPKNLY